MTSPPNLGHAASDHSGLVLSHSSYRGERHGRWGSGAARAAVFGMSDGLVSNVSLVAAVAGASWGRTEVLVSGLAGLAAGALSMAAGEYASVRANRELLESELEVERREIRDDPAGETRELAGIYVERGLDRETALLVATRMMADDGIALEAHARDELGIDPSELGSPVAAAGASLVAFSIGAAVPVLPWFLIGGATAVLLSVVLGVVGAAALGVTLARITRRSTVRLVTRQVGLLLAACAVTTAIGRLVGGVVA